MFSTQNLYDWSMARWARIRSHISSPLVLALVVFIGAALWLDKPFGTKTTLGTILIDSPEIYTRERLVNDRFLEDAWLSAHLDPPSEIQDARQVRSELRRVAVQAGSAKEAASGDASAPTALGTNQTAAVEPRLSSKVKLLEQVDYREVVRNLLIENQLDDRHDLNGNSLYKLKFDTAILPGVNTQASAQITVRLMPPRFLTREQKNDAGGSLADLGSKEDIEAWRKVYARWIDSLRSRLNQTHRELMEAYYNNEFSHNDYARLIGFFSQHLQVSTALVGDCPRAIVDLGQDTSSLRLSNKQHVDRKACVLGLVEKSIPPTMTTGFEGPAKLGDYGAKVTGTELNPAARPRRAEDTLQLWLNSFFAARTVKLVLGVPVHEAAFVTLGWHQIPAFQNLARLTFFNSSTTSAEGNDVFHVSEKIFSIPAIDPQKVLKEKLDVGIEVTQGHKLKDFVPSGFAPQPFLISKPHLTYIQEERLRFAEQEFKELSDARGVYLASAEVGLLKFAKLARQKMVAFTYGVTPKESADSVHLSLSTYSNVTGQPPAATDPVAAMRLQREFNSRSVERRSGVVGFSGISSDNSVAQFGWLISPRQNASDGAQAVYVQAPAQYALSALVSIPSWWHNARLEAVTTWLGKDGTPIQGTEKKYEYDIDVPTDFEPLEALLLGIEQVGPEIMESRIDPVWLTACRPGAIIIPGRRLWRSTKVTLGYQTADAISVLPNMKGIIATFDSVDNQLSLPEEVAWRQKHSTDAVQIQRAVRVWTSQGSLTLPTLATIGVPPGTAATCPKTRPSAAVSK